MSSFFVLAVIGQILGKHSFSVFYQPLPHNIQHTECTHLRIQDLFAYYLPAYVFLLAVLCLTAFTIVPKI